MTELVKVGELSTQEVINSLELVKQVNLFRSQEGNRAELQHKDFLKVVRDEFEEEIGEGNISLTSYKDVQGKERPMFELTMSQARQVLVRESKFVRKAVIAYINKLENAIKEQTKIPQTYIEALEALLVVEKEKERLLVENKNQSNEIVEMAVKVSEMKEKVSYVDTILSSKKTVTMTQLSQDYGLSAKTMNKKLESLGVQRKVGGQWVLYAAYLPCGYVQSKTVNITRSSGQPDIVLNTEWTQKGRLFLYHKLKENDIIPTIEK